ncbi:8059_t:CDS:2 [Diversispora eburnea]|uniref:8059_t:CDS:1 n=1 Tax=Diversispora eburnea TaxID=1213867 RepID=A0A9N8ZE51_9GLOM|nr:8059_t:CDS:2 [Diversispora eburnea]
MALSRKLTRLFSRLQKPKSRPKQLKINTSVNFGNSADDGDDQLPTTPFFKYYKSPSSSSLYKSPSSSLYKSPSSSTTSLYKSPFSSHPYSPRPKCSDIKFLIPPEIFIEICLHLPPKDLYTLSTVCVYFRNMLWSTSTTTQTIWESSRTQFLSYPKLPPPFDMTEQEYIWLTILPKNCQLCSKPYKPYLYDIWPSRIIACEDERPRCMPKELFGCIPYTRFFYYEIFIIYWIPDIESTKLEYNSLDKSQKIEWVKERKEQVIRSRDELRYYFQQDYQEVYKCGVFNPNAKRTVPCKKETMEILMDSQDMYARSSHIDWNDSELDEFDWTEWTR